MALSGGADVLGEVRARQIKKGCVHARTVSVVTAGLERVICETCGAMTLNYESMISGHIERSMFSRKADELHPDTNSAEPPRELIRTVAL